MKDALKNCHWAYAGGDGVKLIPVESGNFQTDFRGGAKDRQLNIVS